MREGDREETENNQIRKQCYKVFMTLLHGSLGRGNRRELPRCIVDAIRDEYPDEVYMGYKPS